MDFCVFLSNRCNLLCRYCTILLNEGEAHYLSAEQVCRGVDHYMLGAPSEQEKSVVYLGGEPLLKFDLIRETVSYVRSRYPQARQHLYTNGSLLTREIYSFLWNNRVDVTVSLDGKKSSNDAFRVLYKREEASAWDAVMERLRELPLRALSVNMVFTPDTVSELVANFDFMRKLGFQRIDFNPDTCRKMRILDWDAPALKRARASSQALAGYLEEQLLNKKVTFTCPHLTFFPRAAVEPSRNAWWHRFESTLLGADGNFYPCESLFIFPYETLEPYRLGDLKSGIDRGKQDALAAEAREFVLDRFGPEQRFYNCPLNTYFFAKRAGEDPERLIRGLIAVWDEFTGPLIDFERKYPGVFGTPGVTR